MKAVEMIIPVPKCFAKKKILAHTPASRPNATGSPLAILLPSDRFTQPDTIGISTPSAEVMRTIKTAPMWMGILYSSWRIAPHASCWEEQSPCLLVSS